MSRAKSRPLPLLPAALEADGFQLVILRAIVILDTTTLCPSTHNSERFFITLKCFLKKVTGRVSAEIFFLLVK